MAAGARYNKEMNTRTITFILTPVAAALAALFALQIYAPPQTAEPDDPPIPFIEQAEDRLVDLSFLEVETIFRARNGDGRPHAIVYGGYETFFVVDVQSNHVAYLGSAESIVFDGLNNPTDGLVTADGQMLIVDSGNHAIRVVSPDQYTLAGGQPGHLDGTLHDVDRFALPQFNSPTAIAIDEAGNLYIADTGNHVIRKVDTDGMVTTIAGIPGESGYYDGAADTALFNRPMGIAVSPSGEAVYVADTGNHLIRVIANGSVRTLAGRFELGGDGQPVGGFDDAPLSRLNAPVGLALANDPTVGDVLIVADSENHRIRAVWPWGEIVNLAGTGSPGFVEGDTSVAAFDTPMGVHLHRGTLYIADTGNGAVRQMQLLLLMPG